MPRSVLCLLAAALVLGGCSTSSYLAGFLVRPPNGGRAFVDPARAVPVIFDTAEHLAVAGPPPAQLAFYVFEPAPARVSRHDLTPAAAAELLVPHAHDPPDARVSLAPWSRDQKALRIARGRPAGDTDVAPDARATVLLLQGFGNRGRTSDYLWHVAAWLAADGCRVVLIDLRAQGDSTGPSVTGGRAEVTDLKQLLDHLHATGRLDGPVGVVGHSYGGGVAVQLAAHDRRVARVLAFAPLVDLRATLYGGLRYVGRTERPLLWALVGWAVNERTVVRSLEKAGARAGYDPAVHNALAAAPRVRVPVDVFQGDRDLATPIAEARRLVAANPEHFRLTLYPEGTHAAWLRQRLPELRRRLTVWVDRLRSAPAASAPAPHAE